MRTLTLPILVSLVAAAAGCGTSDDNGTTPDPAAHDTVRSSLARDLEPAAEPAQLGALAAGNRALALDIYRGTAPEGANYMTSAFSIQQAFALVYAGARGETATEMADVLYFGDDAEALHTTMNALDLALSSRNLPAGDGENEGPVQIRVANAFWGQTGYPWLASYLDVLALNYGAGIEALDFDADPEGARAIINAWVEDRTEDRIVNLLPEGSIRSDTAAVLTNAIYFKAPWNVVFDEDLTEDGEFTRLDNSTVTAPMMSHLERHLGASGDGWSAVEMSFRGEELAMLFVVPDAGTFAAFDTTLDAAMLDSIVEALSPMQVDVTLPRFSFESEFTLSDALKALGMTTAFGGSADLSGMLEGGGLFIDEAYHKAFIAVDEGGAEAAAATAVVVGETSVPTPDLEVVADRPFYFAIRDRETGLFLFFGRVMDPTA